MENEVNVMPRIGEKAPVFKANTTQGPINFPEDFEGKWIILFSHPSDFTPVCTSEFMTFGKMMKEFDSLNCQLIGLSVDGINSHIAWLRAIKDKIKFRGMKKVEIQFPLIEDLTMSIAQKYGMIQPNESTTAAVRAVFVIDPQGIIRTILYYPLALGRNIKEIRRILIGLQTIDNFKIALPADWIPGDEVIIPPASTVGGAEAATIRKENGIKCYDWFFCTKKLSRQEVESKLSK